MDQAGNVTCLEGSLFMLSEFSPSERHFSDVHLYWSSAVATLRNINVLPDQCFVTSFQKCIQSVFWTKSSMTLLPNVRL